MSSEERFRAIFSLAAIGLSQCDVQTHRFLAANHRMEESTAIQRMNFKPDILSSGSCSSECLQRASAAGCYRSLLQLAREFGN
jgi:hypothetical protein